MSKFLSFLAVALAALSWSPGCWAEAKSPGPEWLPWSPELWPRAQREKRFVLLNLHAVWCHWCHVMEETTYRDPAVLAFLHAKYLPVQVDADARPDLAGRYEDYGWPATIVFASDGSEIVRRRGYLPPAEMASLLQAIIDDPSPGPSVTPERPIAYAKSPLLPEEQHRALEGAMSEGYDSQLGSWGTSQKFLDWDNTEFCLVAALHGAQGSAAMARQTLNAQLQLLDPVWGGVNQYSAEGDWKHPHFEKLIQFQAENLRIYSLAYAAWGDAAYRQAAERIRGYVRTFLTSPEGAFYVSQDADLVPGEHSGAYYSLGDAARRKLGVPRVDTHQYARENGWMIRGLLACYRATAQPEALAQAHHAAEWVAAERALPGGGFRHDVADAAGPYLGDTVAMGEAFLELYAATADPAELTRAERAADFMAAHFCPDLQRAGLVSAETKSSVPPLPRPQYDENVAVARFANLLFHYTGRASDRALAECACRFLVTPETGAHRGAFVGGILLAGAELATEPWHVTVVGPKGDSLARTLFQSALATPLAYGQTEWLDPAEGRLPHQPFDFPSLGGAAAYLCAEGACSAPIRDAAALRQKLPHVPAD